VREKKTEAGTGNRCLKRTIGREDTRWDFKPDCKGLLGFPLLFFYRLYQEIMRENDTCEEVN